MEPRDARTLSPLQLDELRLRAICLWKKGFNRRKISGLLDVHYNTVGRWVCAYVTEGPGALRSAKRGRKKGGSRNLTPAQEKEVQKMITDKTPDQLKMPFALWTRRAVCDLVEEFYRVRLPERTCGEYLKRWGFTAQRPARRNYEQNPEAVRRWIEQEYPQIAKRAKKEGAEIHWGDETGVRNDCQHGRGFAPAGKTPVVRNSSKRFGINMISSVTNQGKVRWMVYRDSFNARIFIKFMSRLIKDAKGKIILIVDNLRVHHCRPVKEWVARRKSKIELAFLPSYSPEHNPDEYLNCDLKSALGKKPSPRTQGDLEQNLKGHMRMLSKSRRRAASYFEAKPIRYAAAA
jgi:transposase